MVSHLAEIKYLVIMTPLQLRHARLILENQKVEIVLYTDNISLSEIIVGFPTAEHIALTDNIFRRKDLLKDPCLVIKRYRKTVRVYKELIGDLISKHSNPVTLYCGSDKNIYVQLLARQLQIRKQLNALIAIDEGIGYYRPRSRWRVINQGLYWIGSRMLLNEAYDYVDVLGTWKLVTEVRVRWPDKLQYRRADTNYLSLNMLDRNECTRANNETLNQHHHILILSSPLAVDRLVTNSKELELFQNLIEVLITEGYDISIKPHPRDDTLKFTNLSQIQNLTFDLIDGNELAEDLNYWDYGVIINFKSSAVLDILASGYPSERIITFCPIVQLRHSLGLFSTTEVCWEMNDVLRVITGRLPK